MTTEPILEQTPSHSATNAELTQRVAQLEAALAELQATVDKFINPSGHTLQHNGTHQFQAHH